MFVIWCREWGAGSRVQVTEADLADESTGEKPGGDGPIVDRPIVDPPSVDGPIDAEEFAQDMGRLGPFEAAPRLTVGVSGGSDSLSLCLLADQWVKDRGGSLLALTVDHGLRPGSGDEAKWLAANLAARGIDHTILPWTGPKPDTRVHESARAARHALLIDACRGAAVAHLLLGHCLEDQAETLLLRLSKGSGVDGLAGIAPIRETAGPRLLRPLLGKPKSRLRATCRSFAQAWIDDPSNADARFARSRLRTVTEVLGGEGLSADRLAGTARRAGLDRAALETAVARAGARAVTLFPEGYARIDWAAMDGEPAAVRLRLLSAVLRTVGGGEYPPRLERLERLSAMIDDGTLHGGRTLAGCRICPDTRSGSRAKARLIVSREVRPGGQRVPLFPGRTVVWDRRFAVSLAGECPSDLAAGLEVGACGSVGRALRGGLPARVAAGLPGFWRDGTLLSAGKNVAHESPAASAMVHYVTVEFAPAQPFAGPTVAVV